MSAMCCCGQRDELHIPCHRRVINWCTHQCTFYGCFRQRVRKTKYQRFGSKRKHDDEEVLQGFESDDELFEEDRALIQSSQAYSAQRNTVAQPVLNYNSTTESDLPPKKITSDHCEDGAPSRIKDAVITAENEQQNNKPPSTEALGGRVEGIE